MKNIIVGLLLSLQFFTSFPIRKTLPMNNKTVTAMFGTMPFISFFMGVIVVLVILLNDVYFNFTPLFLAIIIVIINIMMTGGLHLDGWIDLSDAYFSYRDKEKRLEILSDSRIGAFGAINLVLIVLLKIGIFYEYLHQRPTNFYLFFIILPVLCRLAILIYFNLSVNVKESGLAAYFKKHVKAKSLWIYIACYIFIILITGFVLNEYKLFVLTFSMFVMTWIYRHWTYRHFGGMTGDLLGALYEGMELALWGMLLLFI